MFRGFRGGGFALFWALYCFCCPIVAFADGSTVFWVELGVGLGSLAILSLLGRCSQGCGVG